MGQRGVSFQKDAARLGCVPGGTQVEDLGSFHNEAGEGWHLKGAGDAVLDVVIETDAQFGSGRCQRHERVPGRGALTGARAPSAGSSSWRASWQSARLAPGSP